MPRLGLGEDDEDHASSVLSSRGSPSGLARDREHSARVVDGGVVSVMNRQSSVDVDEAAGDNRAGGAGRGEEEVPGKGRNDGKGSGGRKGGTDEDEETKGVTSLRGRRGSCETRCTRGRV